MTGIQKLPNGQVLRFNVLRVISEHKTVDRAHPVHPGMKRVQAIVQAGRWSMTRHVDIPR